MQVEPPLLASPDTRPPIGPKVVRLGLRGSKCNCTLRYTSGVCVGGGGVIRIHYTHLDKISKRHIFTRLTLKTYPQKTNGGRPDDKATFTFVPAALR